MKDKDGRLVVSEKDRGKLWKDHMEKIMNVENQWDQTAEADMVEGPVEEVTYEEVIKIKGSKLCCTCRKMGFATCYMLQVIPQV